MSSLARSYSEANDNVTGTTSATVPMAQMQIFEEKEKVITVNCKAELRIPNFDVMFVLDTTGSMEQIPVNSTITKMVGLRRAVKCFLRGAGQTKYRRYHASRMQRNRSAWR